MNNVYLYWNGPTFSLISILRKLIYQHSNSGNGYNVHLITPDNIQEYVSYIPECFFRLQYAHQADYVRVMVLCDRGGIWLDSDTIVMGSLDPLFDLIHTHKSDGFFIQHYHGGVCNGIFGTRPNTRIMTYWRRRMIEKVNRKHEHLRWSEIGSYILNTTDSSRNFFKNYTLFDGHGTMYPVNFDTCEAEFISKPYENYKTIVRAFQPLVILTNSVYRRLENKSEEEIMQGTMPLNYFLNTSTQNLRT